MENNNLIINKVINQSLSKGTRIFRVVYGVFLLVLGLLLIAKKGFSFKEEMSIIGVGIIIIGIGSILYGYIGKVIVKDRIRVILNDETIKIKKSFEPQSIIKLKSAKLIKFNKLDLEVSYNDYAKSYDFSFLNDKEFEKVKECIANYCSINNIVIEQ